MMSEDIDAQSSVDSTDGDKKQDFSDVVGNIEKIVSEKVSEGISAIEKKLDSSPKAVSEDLDIDLWGDSEDSEEVISKKDIPKIIKQVKESVVKETKEAMETSSRKKQRDFEAMRDFPELSKESPHFSKRLYNEVSNEIDRRVKGGKAQDDVDLIYDSASATVNRGLREGWHKPHFLSKKEIISRNTKDDSFSLTGDTVNSGGPTEGQLKYAKQAGLSKERFSQLLEKVSK